MVSPGTHLVNKSWVPLQNHRVPVQKTISPNLKMLGPLCDQVDKGYSFVKHNKVLKNYASFNNGQKNSHRNHTNRISYKKHLQIDQLIFASYMGRMPYTFVHFGGFLCIKDAGRRGDKITVLIFFIIIMIIVLLVHGKSHTRGTNEIHSIYMCLIQPPI